MRILIAPNAFKNSLDAAAAAQAIQEGLKKSGLECVCECFPVGDGGDGTGKLLVERKGGRFIKTETTDSLGRKIAASYGLINEGRTVVVEMAEASGIKLLKQDDLNPLYAVTDGTGILIRNALDRSIDEIVVAMGGSATVDGGSGILRVLGVRFLEPGGREITDLPIGLKGLDSIDLSGLDQRILQCKVVVMCDVENRLLGEEGAAAVFGPQKGATKEVILHLEEALSRLRDIALKVTGVDMSEVKGGGTAGGAAAGLYAFLNASLVDGISYYLDSTGFKDKLEHADLVITGEGSIDMQTLQGKGPFGVALMAREKKIPVIGFAGKIPLNEIPELSEYFHALLPIGNGPADVNSAMADTYLNLLRTAFNTGALLKLSSGI
ncbi:glycerate kinase family protein [Pararcticibacter amylolyticus]|uniref:Glycerate kinase n=1 Tax=Pararcticibacter amylolyticus TaxID=2173175 RepID=A0A2U2PH73_9SPHI|nr:glycerate kinase [Pararcticibacter amylolyticus]PWG80761.1 glycerate kinase [Pararcticibacter amylolyticus]